MLSCLTPHPEGVVVEVWVTPGAARPGMGGIHDGALRVRTGAPAEAGRANRAVVELLVEALHARSGDLLSGRRSRRKRVLVRGVSAVAAERALLEEEGA